MRAAPADLFPVLVLAMALGGCTSERVAPAPVRLNEGVRWVTTPEAGTETVLDPSSPWRLVPEGTSLDRGALATSSKEEGPMPNAAAQPLRSGAAPLAPAMSEPPVRPPAPVRPAAPSLALPTRRGPAPPAPGQRTLEELAEIERRHFLRHPTRIVAERVTVYCPPALFPRAVLDASDVRAQGPSRRDATGRARLLLDELTVEAGYISLRLREDGSQDFHLQARGTAGMVSVVGDKVLRHENLGGLLVTNAQVLPIP